MALPAWQRHSEIASMVIEGMLQHYLREGDSIVAYVMRHEPRDQTLVALILMRDGVAIWESDRFELPDKNNPIPKEIIATLMMLS